MPEVIVDLSPLPPVTVPTGEGSVTVDAITPSATVSVDAPSITVGVPGQAGPPGATGPQGPPGVNNLWTGTQAAYDALPVKDPAVVYVIT